MRLLSKTLLLTVALFVGLFASVLVVPVAAAQGRDSSDNRQYMIAQQDGPTLSEAVERVRRQYNGRIVSAETKVRGKREIHIIKVLTDDGKVRTITIPGRARGS